MIKWPQELVHDIAKQRASIFLGAGVSINAVGVNNQRPPTWAQFLKSALELCPKPNRHIKSLIAGGDYLTACEILRSRLDEGWVNLLRESFVTPRFREADIHKHIFDLDCKVVLTSNVDKIYDIYASTQTQGDISVVQYNDQNACGHLRDRRHVIVKIHGSIDSPADTIFTRMDYAQARSKHRDFYSILDALFVLNTCLFVGSGARDPDIMLLLEDICNRDYVVRPHYICMASSSVHSDVADVLRSSGNIKVLRYSSRNNHQELTESIKQLVLLVNEVRNGLIESGRIY